MKLALAVALAFASSTAAALGLGQIEVKSRLDQPLLAEIPIISSDPSELERLQARLASPETFARVGLQAPQGLVSNLQFMVALDNAGNPVIRVTSAQPVDQPLLTFLIEVDWGQGRLVREYSALLDTPRTLSAPAQPSIQAPVVAPPNTIVRAPEVAPTPEPGDEAQADDGAAVPDQEVQDTGADTAIAVPPVPPAAPAAAAAPIASEPAVAGQYVVQSGDTLSEIAGRMASDGFNINQAMIALLRANPDAFIDDNINLLKSGTVLRVPDAADEAFNVEAAEALALVRTQVQQWREATRPAPQPADAIGAPAAAATSTATTAVSGTEPAAAGTARRASDARLEIVPPGASAATRAGTQSGISAGGEGDMLLQELQQSQETLAARDAELEEMRGRIADLEQLQQQQQQLLTLKDSELAAAQQRLAETGQTSVSGEPAPAPASSLPWILGGLALLLAVLGGWLWNRRSRASAPVFRAPVAAGNSSLADAFPVRPMPGTAGGSAVATDVHEPETIAAVGGSPIPSASVPESPDTPAPARPAAAAPFWVAEPPRPVSDTPPTWHQPADAAERHVGLVDPQPAVLATSVPAEQASPDVAADGSSSANERLELARAYLDLGDRDSARQLLGEVTLDGDAATRQQAAQMLREID